MAFERLVVVTPAGGVVVEVVVVAVKLKRGGSAEAAYGSLVV